MTKEAVDRIDSQVVNLNISDLETACQMAAPWTIQNIEIDKQTQTMRVIWVAKSNP